MFFSLVGVINYCYINIPINLLVWNFEVSILMGTIPESFGTKSITNNNYRPWKKGNQQKHACIKKDE